MTQFLDATVIGGLRANLGIGHHLFAVNKEFFLKKVVVP
tara:strand:- start:815 stop:931 length:117 start_codon:yes stop_codon:yes gene_type:complete